MFTISPLLQDLPRDRLHVAVKGDALGFEGGSDRFSDGAAKIFERDRHGSGHLGRRIDIRAKEMAGHAGELLDSDDAVRRSAARSHPALEGALRLQSEGAHQLLLTAYGLCGRFKCFCGAHGRINAQTANRVNARTVMQRVQNFRMETQNSPMDKAPPSPLWQRLTVAMKAAKLPVSQNGIATLLDMSQGSVRRWFTGEGLPELKTAIDLAERTGFCVEWILTGRGPERPDPYDADLSDLIRHWRVLQPEGRLQVLRTAKLEHAVQFTGDSKERDRVQQEMVAFSVRSRAAQGLHDGDPIAIPRRRK